MGVPGSDELPIRSGTVIEIMPHVSGVIDHERKQAVLLNERIGRYWRVSGYLLEMIRDLAEAPEGCTCEDLLREVALRTEIRREDLEEAVCALRAAGLISVGKRTSELSPSRPETSGRLRQPFDPPDRASYDDLREFHSQPSLTLVVRYALLSLWYAILLYLMGWSPVWAIRSRQRSTPERISSYRSGASMAQDRVVEELIAVVRWACVFPWVRRDCIRHSLALHRLLTTMGYAPVLQIGGEVVGFEPHMWVELNGIRIDSGDDDQSLEKFAFLAERPGRGRN